MALTEKEFDKLQLKEYSKLILKDTTKIITKHPAHMSCGKSLTCSAKRNNRKNINKCLDSTLICEGYAGCKNMGVEYFNNALKEQICAVEFLVDTKSTEKTRYVSTYTKYKCTCGYENYLDCYLGPDVQFQHFISNIGNLYIISEMNMNTEQMCIYLAYICAICHTQSSYYAPDNGYLNNFYSSIGNHILNHGLEHGRAFNRFDLYIMSSYNLPATVIETYTYTKKSNEMNDWIIELNRIERNMSLSDMSDVEAFNLINNHDFAICSICKLNFISYEENMILNHMNICVRGFINDVAQKDEKPHGPHILKYIRENQSNTIYIHTK